MENEIIEVETGQVKIAKAGTVLRCLSLGSCVAVVIYDSKHHIGGVAHVMLPSMANPTDGDKGESLKYADQAIHYLIKGLLASGTKRENLKAKLFGGALVSKDTIDVGAQNVQAVKDKLVKEDIEITEQRLGGNESRSIVFDPATGIVNYTELGGLKEVKKVMIHNKFKKQINGKNINSIIALAPPGNITKKIIALIIIGLLLVAIPFWFFFVIPHLSKLPKDFTYEAEVISSDNFYDQAKGAFSGASISATKFSYSVVGQQNGVLIIKNIFDVRKLTGEPIFSVERLYGIDPITGKHVAGFGDKNRDGYLFAPKNLKKGEPFTYWHINYNGPAHMQFAGQETINGLTVYRYQTHYEGVTIDQTKNLGFLPGVGVTRGVNLDPYLQLWIEPQTGTLINYKDETTAYYYDLATGKRLYPWNQFSNTFKHSSIITQVEIAKQKKLFIFVINFGASIAIILIAFITILVWSLRRLYMAKKDTVKNLEKLEENQIKLKGEQIKLKNAMTIASLQNVQLEKTKTATLNVLEDLKIQEQKLTEAKAKDDALLESIGDGVIATDSEGKIILMNQTAQEMLGWHPENMTGKLLYDVVIIEDEKGNVIPREKRPIYLALAGTTTTTTTTTTTGPTYVYERKDKTKFPVAIKVTAVIIDNKIVGAIEVFRDITKEKEIDKAKSEFVSLASHQLRTPLGIMKWYLEAWKNEDYFKKSPQVIKDYFDEVYKSNERVLSLVRDLLSVSRIDQGRVKDAPKPVNILEIITDTVTQMQILAKSKKVTLHLELKAQKLPSMYLDPIRFHEVIENLVTNAIEYTQALGKVEVTVDESNDTVTVSIQDTGMGISAEDKVKLFDKFFRSQEAMVVNSEGSGLGLYVVKSYVEQWGGKISVESVEGKGSTFLISLPIKDVIQKDRG